MKRKKLISIFSFLIGVPLLLAIGFFILKDRKYNLISMGIVILVCLPFFYAFEKKETTSRQIVLLAVMVALAVTSRAAFYFIPSLNPLAAIVIISGIFLGSDFGFMTGALAAIISNMIFGQGPWTPFQMFSWGVIGLISGIPIIAKKARTNRLVLIFLGAFSGILFSFLMDIWTVLSWDKVFTIKRYLMVLVPAIPMTLSYVVANIIFLLLLVSPIGKRLERIKNKYGM